MRWGHEEREGALVGGLVACIAVAALVCLVAWARGPFGPQWDRELTMHEAADAAVLGGAPLALGIMVYIAAQVRGIRRDRR